MIYCLVVRHRYMARYRSFSFRELSTDARASSGVGSALVVDDAVDIVAVCTVVTGLVG